MTQTNTHSDKEITYFAKTNFRNQDKKFGIQLEDRRRHMYVVGKTGVGKTVLLENMAIQDIEKGHGICYIDPNGDSIENILKCIPSERINDVIFFNPADTEYPLAFNILENVSAKYRHLVSDGLMGVFTKIWANMWSSRMEYILRNCILALLEVPGNTLLGIMRLLADKDFRKKIVDKVQDPVVKSFWVNEYANYNDRFRIEAIAPIQNKIGQFLSSSVIRNIVGQPKSTIDPREIMDEGKILLMDLSKGKIGEDNSALLGAMMVTKIQLAAMSRANIPEEDRTDFFLYVDEFQNFATESFADILSEARKYHLGLIMAHQYIAQLTTPESTKVRDAVFGNVGTMVCFRVGAADAFYLLKEFEPYFIEEDLVNLEKYHIYLKLLINGVSSRPFSATTLPPLSEGKQNLDNMKKAVKVSRERYSSPKAEVEEKIIRWLDLEKTMQDEAKEGKLSGAETIYKKGTGKTDNTGDKKSRQDTLEAVCDNCGKKTYLSFRPRADLNVFCKECLKLFKSGQIDVNKLEFHNLDIAIDNKQSKRKPKKDSSSQAPQSKIKKEEIKLDDLKTAQPKDFKSSGGRNVKQGESVKL